MALPNTPKTDWDATDGVQFTDMNEIGENLEYLDDGLQRKIIEIGDWNMDTDSTITIAHGLDKSTIKSIQAIIIADNETPLFAQTFNIGYIGVTGSLGGGILFDVENIFLGRATGGQFDGGGFNATSYNRGWITILYEE